MQYRGLIVGGPRAGSHISAYAPRIRLVVPSQMQFDFDGCDRPVSDTMETFEYVYVEGLRGMIQTDFWIPAKQYTDPISAAVWAVRTIIESYKEQHK